jgi:hypothetical protein
MFPFHTAIPSLGHFQADARPAAYMVSF